jgi:hypothetical protein
MFNSSHACLGACPGDSLFECEDFRDVGRCFECPNVSILDIREDIKHVTRRMERIEEKNDELEENNSDLDDEILVQDLWAIKWKVRIFGMEGSTIRSLPLKLWLGYKIPFC